MVPDMGGINRTQVAITELILVAYGLVHWNVNPDREARSHRSAGALAPAKFRPPT